MSCGAKQYIKDTYSNEEEINIAMNTYDEILKEVLDVTKDLVKPLSDGTLKFKEADAPKVHSAITEINNKYIESTLKPILFTSKDTLYLNVVPLANLKIEAYNEAKWFSKPKYNTYTEPSVILNKLTTIGDSILDPTYNYEGDDRYSRKTDTGIVKVLKRVTDKQSAKFRKIFGKDTADEINNNPINVRSRNYGVALHKVTEGIINHIMYGKAKPSLTVVVKGAKEPITITDAHYKSLYENISKVLTSIKDTQKNIDSSSKAKILVEQKIYDPKTDTAGSIDLLAIYSDGSASVFDWKFLKLPTDRTGKISEDGYNKLFNKMDSWNSQLNDYKRILTDVYNIKKFNHTRVVPTNMRFLSGKEGTGKLKELNTDLTQIPLADELTGDTRLDALLDNLFKVRNTLINDKKTANVDKKVIINDRLKNITKTIARIQIEKDVTLLFNDVKKLINTIDNRVGIEDIENPLYLTNDEIREFLLNIDLYDNIVVNTKETTDKLKSTDKERYNKVEAVRSNLDERLKFSKEKLQNLQQSRLEEMASDKKVKNINEVQKEVGVMGSLFTYLSDYAHPIFKLLYKYVLNKQDTVRNKVKSLYNELKDLDEALVTWASAKGLKGEDVYKHLLKKTTRTSEDGTVHTSVSLVSRLNSKYTEDLNKARKNKDVAWFKNNFIVTDEDKAYFKAYREKRYANIEKVYAAEGKEVIEAKKREFDRNYDLSKSDDAWLNKFSKKTLKNPEKYYSEEYKFILANKPLLDYYNFYTKTIKDLGKKVNVNSSTFVPNIKKSLMRKFTELGAYSYKNLDLTSSLEAQEFENSSFDLYSNDLDKDAFNIKAPIYFTRDLDSNEKSLDLSKSLLLFADMAYNHEYTESVKGDIYVMRSILENNKQYETDRWGNINVINGVPSLTKTSKKHLENFDSFIQAYFENKTLQSKDAKIKVFGKDLSKNNTLLSAMNYFSIRNLALNPISIMANWVGARANLYYLGLKDAHFNTDDLKASHVLFAKRDKKYLAVYDFFDFTNDKLTYKLAKNVSRDSKFDLDTLYIGQHATDQAIDNTLISSMMMGYGIAEDGTVKVLRALPEGTKSLWDLAKLDESGKMSIEGLTEEGFNDFRNKAKYLASLVKGSVSSEDIALYKTSLAGMMFMQFRNWIPRLVQERYKSEDKYNEVLNQVEIGRYNAVAREFYNKGIVENARILLNFIPIVGHFFTKNYEFNEDYARQMYRKFLEESNLNEEDVSLDEYLHVTKGQVVAAAAELRMYLTVLLIGALLMGDWDDDDEPDYKKYWATKKLVQALDRVNAELGTFFNPLELTKLVKGTVPLLGLVEDLYKLAGNTWDESTDVILGEDDGSDRTPVSYYLSKFVPIVNPLMKFSDFYHDESDEPEGEFIEYNLDTDEDEHSIQLEY